MEGMDRMSKVMTMGEILVEVMATRVGQTFREAGQLVGPFASGAPAIFIDQVAKLGVRAGIIGCVGDDDFGVLNIERLRADGVDVSGIGVLKTAVTGSAFVTYRKDGERDFIFNVTNSASAQLSSTNVTEEVLRGCTHFHVMGSSLFSFRIIDAMKRAIEIVKNQGGTISFDPNIRKEMLRIPEMREALLYILELTDVFMPSGAEVTLLANAATEKGAVDELLAAGVKEIVIKRGSQGCTYFDAHGRHDERAFHVAEIDPTGAGDCFGATYVACRQLGHAPQLALKLANAAGALAVGVKGPMEGTSTLRELEQFSHQHAEGAHHG